MSLLITTDDLKNEFKFFLNRIKEEGVKSERISQNTIEPLVIPLNTNGEVLTLTCNNINKFLESNSKLRLTYTIPHEYLDIENSYVYAKDVHDSKSLDIIHTVVNDLFGVKRFNLILSKSSSKTHIFKSTVVIDDPAIVSISNNYEIKQILKINIKKEYIYKQKDKSLITEANDKNTDMIIKPNLTSKDVSFDDTITIFGSELSVDYEKNINAISLKKDGETYACVNNLDGDWTYLID